jgi:membrane protein required for colicin V production
MVVLDWIFIALVAISVLLGLMRGLVREIISLAGWIAGGYLAIRFGAALGAHIPIAAEWKLVNTILAGVLIFVGCVFASALLGWIVRQFLVTARLSMTDRTIGALFGLLRGVLIVALAVFLARGTPVAEQPFWRASQVVPLIEAALRLALPYAAQAALKAT